MWRLSIIREVLLSGFQLELYVEDEKPFVYWQLSQVANEHRSVLDALESVIPEGEFLPKPAVSVLNVQPIGRYPGTWRTYLHTFVSQCFPVTLHRDVHGKTLGHTVFVLHSADRTNNAAHAARLATASKAPRTQLCPAVQVGVSSRICETTSTGSRSGFLGIRERIGGRPEG